MKTLYERLEPEILEGLEYNKKQHEFSVDSVISNLSHTNSGKT